MKWIFLLFVLLLGVVAPVFAGYEEGVAAYKRGDYAVAFRELRPLAEKRNPRAQAIIGRMYLTGKGVPKDQPKAFAWFRKAADQGHVIAQSMVKYMCNEGQVPGEPVCDDIRRRTEVERRRREQACRDAAAAANEKRGSGRTAPKGKSAESAPTVAWRC